MSRLPFDPSKMGGVPAPTPGGSLPAGGGLFAGGAARGGGAPSQSPATLSRPGTASAGDSTAAIAASGASVGAVPAGERPPISVAQLAAIVEGLIRDHLPGTIRVLGEISNFSNRTHWYFSLKEGQVGGAVINCVMFAGCTRGVGFVPGEGQAVVLTGRVEYYKPQGKVSFAVEKIEPVGEGALELAYRQLVQELRRLGYFAPERKRALPTFPRRVAIITSRSGAALQDVINTMKRRCPAVELVLIDALMQGRQAAPGVARAIQWAGVNAPRLGIDVILLTRGGGSIEDLWAFNERIVADAVFQCPVPIVCAIGHETDTTIAELVADERCSTPTQAAMRLTPDREELGEQLEMVRGRLESTLRRALRQERDAIISQRRHLQPVLRAMLDGQWRLLAQLSARLERTRPTAVLHRRAMELGSMADRLASAMRSRLAQLDGDALRADLHDAMARSLSTRRESLGAMHRQLGLVGPLSVLARGYSVTTDPLGRIVRRVSDVAPGDVLATRVEDGVIESVVGSDAPPRVVPVRGTVGGVGDGEREHERERERETEGAGGGAGAVGERVDGAVDAVVAMTPRASERGGRRAKAGRAGRPRSGGMGNDVESPPDFKPGPGDLDGQLGLF